MYFRRLTFQAVTLLPCPGGRLTRKRIIIIQINNHGRNVTNVRSTCWTCVSCLPGPSLVATTTPTTMSRDGRPRLDGTHGERVPTKYGETKTSGSKRKPIRTLRISRFDCFFDTLVYPFVNVYPVRPPRLARPQLRRIGARSSSLSFRFSFPSRYRSKLAKTEN